MNCLQQRNAQGLALAGLIALNSNAFVGNIRRCGVKESFGWGLAQSSSLAKELFHQRTRSDPIALTRSKSRAVRTL